MVKPGVLLAAAALMARGQILFDTDSGFFGDDGVALTMLLRSARAREVQAVTVTSGNVWARSGADFMRRNLRLLGFGLVPVQVGAQRPLVHTAAMSKHEGTIEFAGAFALAVESTESSTAVETMARSIAAAPGRIVVLAIGPMTNLAILLREYPGLERKIGALVFMGGNGHTGGNASAAAEFNFWFDPEAAQAVLRSAIPKKVMFGLDVSSRVKLTRAVFDRVIAAKTPITDLYREDFGNRYPGFLKNANASGSLWDELAAVYLIDPRLVTSWETAYLDVETIFGPRYGATKALDRNIAPDATPVEIALDMDFNRVLEIYVKALTTR